MPLTAHATNEYGTLNCVAMRYADAYTRPLHGDSVHPVLARQQATSSWAEYDTAKVRQQQNNLINLLRARGTQVVILAEAPGCSTQHYPRDIGFVIDSVFFTARLNSAHRLPETQALAEITADMAHVGQLPTGTLEGGDVMLHDNYVLVGLSEESSPEGAAGLQTALANHGIDREVIPVRFATGGIVHLDDHFNIIAADTALIHRAAFTPEQIRWFDHRFDLIDVTDEEAMAVQVNVLAIAPGVVVAATGSDRVTGEIAARGIEVLTVDYSEVTRIPGSLRCTTLPIQRT